MSNWSKLTVSKTIADTACAESVGKSKMMGSGLHIGAHIVSVEPVPGYEAMDVTWANDSGEIRKQRIFFMYKKSESDEEPTSFSTKYTTLGTALTGTNLPSNTPEDTEKAVILFQKFFIPTELDTSIMENLVGLRANIKVALPRRGLYIKAVENGQVVVDIQTDEVKEELSPETNGVFQSYEAAKEATREFNYRLAYLEVSEVMPNEEFIAANRDQLRNVVEKLDSTKTTSSINAAAVQAF